MDSLRPVLERIGNRVPVPQPAYERLLRRRDRRRRNRRLGAAVLALTLTLLAVGAVLRTLRFADVPVDEPTADDRFVGTWTVGDLADSRSRTQLLIRILPGGTFAVVRSDMRAPECGGAGSTVSGEGRLQDDVMRVGPSELRCIRGSVTEVAPWTLTLDRATNSLTGSDGVTWFPLVRGEGSWRGLWPHATREDAEEAQRRADAGEPQTTWQANRRRVAQRFLTARLGWSSHLTTDRGSIHRGGHSSLTFVRCRPGQVNELYSSDATDPDPGREPMQCGPARGTRFDQVQVTVERLLRNEVGGSGSSLPGSSESSNRPSRRRRPRCAPCSRATWPPGSPGRERRRYLATSPSTVPRLYSTRDGSPYEGYRYQLSGPFWPQGEFAAIVQLVTRDRTVVDGVMVFPDDVRAGALSCPSTMSPC